MRREIFGKSRGDKIKKGNVGIAFTVWERGRLNSDAVDQRAYSAEVTQGAIQRIRDAAEQDARQNTADLVALLAENEDDYPLWEASTANPANDEDYFVTPFGCVYGGVML